MVLWASTTLSTVMTRCFFSINSSTRSFPLWNLSFKNFQSSSPCGMFGEFLVSGCQWIPLTKKLNLFFGVWDRYPKKTSLKLKHSLGQTLLMVKNTSKVFFGANQSIQPRYLLADHGVKPLGPLPHFPQIILDLHFSLLPCSGKQLGWKPQITSLEHLSGTNIYFKYIIILYIYILYLQYTHTFTWWTRVTHCFFGDRCSLDTVLLYRFAPCPPEAGKAWRKTGCPSKNGELFSFKNSSDCF